MEKTIVILIFALIPLIYSEETEKDKVFGECLTELSIDEGINGSHFEKYSCRSF